LTEEEKRIVDARLRYDTGTSHGSYNLEETFQWKFIWRALMDWKVWAMIIVYWGVAIPIYG
jgi:hypothetical protein